MSLRCLTRRLKTIHQLCRSTPVLSSLQTKSFCLISRSDEKFLQTNYPSLITRRNKYDKKSSKTEEEVRKHWCQTWITFPYLFKESDGEEDDTDEFDKKSTVKITTQSLRADLLLKAALGIARNKIEAAFYENKIRINGKKLVKKSVSCTVGDEIDLFKNESPVNSNHIVIARIEILSTVPKGDGIVVTMKRYKNLTIEKYQNTFEKVD